MRIAVTGAAGQFGRMFMQIAGRRHDAVAMVHRAAPDMPNAMALDITDREAVKDAVADVGPDWVVHAAAMTDVDGCEQDPEAAHQVNGEGAENVAHAARAAGAHLVHVSTDYVFDGRKGGYTEDDPTRPINEYGRSKLAGEKAVLATMPDAVIARASVVFGPDGRNFVSWLMDSLAAGESVRVVEDQRVSPTYTGDLAHQLLALIQRGAQGIFHTAGADALTRLEMARTVAEVFGFAEDLVHPVRMADLEWVAPRPRDTSLDVSKVSSVRRPTRFPEALRAMAEVRAA